MYSFIKPKPKPLFKEDTKIWLIFMGVSIILYFLFVLFLEIKASFYKEDINYFNREIAYLQKEILEINKEKQFIYKQKNLYEELMAKNILTKNSVKNLLDLVPDPITLNSMLFDENKLIIYGITPTKDIYNMLMLPPLESIFTHTTTYFYQMKNGWYIFKSQNYLKEKK